MDVNASAHNPQVGLGYQILKWTTFVVQLGLLFMLLLITFLVPVVPGVPRGKVPEEAFFVLLSAVATAIAGTIFLRGSRNSAMSLVNLISTPPCVVGITVITIVIVPILIGFLTGR